MTIFYAALLIIYAAGCAAAAVECAAQYAETNDSHPIRTLRRNHPIGNVIAIVMIIACWPLLLNWFSVRDMLR